MCIPRWTYDYQYSFKDKYKIMPENFTEVTEGEANKRYFLLWSKVIYKRFDSIIQGKGENCIPNCNGDVLLLFV